jgi:hypothetical protein
MYKASNAILILFFTILVSPFFFSCQSGGDSNNRLITPNNEIILLNAGEKCQNINKVDKFTFQTYERYFNSIGGIQCPLNKVFHSNTCRFFYGIPMDTDIYYFRTAFLNALALRKIPVLSDTCSGEIKILFADSSTFVVVEFIKTKKNNLLAGMAMSSDSSLIARYYKESNLKTRILDEK